MREVGQYIRTVRVGSLDRTGYSQAAISPLQDMDQETLARRAMLTLTNALSALQRFQPSPALLNDKDLHRQMMEQGVSANLCEALVLVFGKQDTKTRKRSAEAGTTVTMEFGWSPLLAVPQDTPNVIVLDTDRLPLLQELSSILRETTPKENFQFQGLVTDLKRSGRDGIGKVIVHNITSEQPDKVLLEMDDDLYELAIQAHRDKAPVFCVGTLVKNNKSYELLNPSLAPIEAQVAE
jgi:hypothetical protein